MTREEGEHVVVNVRSRPYSYFRPYIFSHALLFARHCSGLRRVHRMITDHANPVNYASYATNSGGQDVTYEP